MTLKTSKSPTAPNITRSTVYYTQCDVNWGHDTDVIWNVSKTVILYVIPLFFMTFAYWQIVRVLWITDHLLTPRDDPMPALSPNMRNEQTQTEGRLIAMRESNSRTSPTSPNEASCSVSRRMIQNRNPNTTQVQLRSRRKAAKMLVSVVVMFTLCCFPVHTINLIRLFIQLEPTKTNELFVLISHWLLYANSALNPVIYNFMSGKFRKEFHSSFNCCSHPSVYARRRQSPKVGTRSSTILCR